MGREIRSPVDRRGPQQQLHTLLLHADTALQGREQPADHTAAAVIHGTQRPAESYVMY